MVSRTDNSFQVAPDLKEKILKSKATEFTQPAAIPTFVQHMNHIAA